jgi:hypothetical protein
LDSLLVHSYDVCPNNLFLLFINLSSNFQCVTRLIRVRNGRRCMWATFIIYVVLTEHTSHMYTP